MSAFYFIRSLVFLILILFAFLSFSCKNNSKENLLPEKKSELISVLTEKPSDVDTPKGMVWIPGGILMQGAIASDPFAMEHERPQHIIAVDGFFMDITEVTNAEYTQFVEETGYVTMAERAIDWEEMKKQLPPGTQKPHDSIMRPGSLAL